MKIRFNGFPDGLKTARNKNAISFAAFLVLVCISLALLDIRLWAGMISLIITVAFGANRAHARYMRDLGARIESGEAPVWDVSLNGVKVGTIPDVEYARIQRRVFTEPRVYVAQALNVLRMAAGLLDSCFRGIPLCVFWIAVALAVFSPGGLSEVLAVIESAPGESIKHAMANVGYVVASALLVLLPLCWLIDRSTFGFVNRFEEAVAVAVRQHCNVAAEGSVQLSRWVDRATVARD